MSQSWGFRDLGQHLCSSCQNILLPLLPPFTNTFKTVFKGGTENIISHHTLLLLLKTVVKDLTEERHDNVMTHNWSKWRERTGSWVLASNRDIFITHSIPKIRGSLWKRRKKNSKIVIARGGGQGNSDFKTKQGDHTDQFIVVETICKLELNKTLSMTMGSGREAQALGKVLLATHSLKERGSLFSLMVPPGENGGDYAPGEVYIYKSYVFIINVTC